MIFWEFIVGFHKFNNLLGRGLGVVKIFMVLRYFEWNERGKAGMVSLPKRK